MDSYPFGSVTRRKTAQHSGCRPLTLSAFMRQSCKVIPFRTFTCVQRKKKVLRDDIICLSFIGGKSILPPPFLQLMTFKVN